MRANRFASMLMRLCLGRIAEGARVLFLLCVPAMLPAQTVSLNGASYTLQPHPRVFVNSALNTRIAYANGSVAPKAVGTNPAWVAVGQKAAAFYSSAPYSNLNYTSQFEDGSVAALYAQYWYSDHSQTQYLTAALYLLNNMQRYVPFACIETTKDCVNGGNGYWAGSYGPAYWMTNWIYAYELVRSQMTVTQQQTFADKFLNDLSTWGGTGLGGSVSATCTNPTVNNSAINVTVNSFGVITASAALFGSGHQIQAGDWVYESDNDVGGVIATVTNSTTANIESDQNGSFSGYSGTLFSRRAAWNNGDCGWLWVAKHDWYTPYSIIQSTTAYPSSGAWGGFAGVGNDNLVLSQTFGPLAALFSLANDDVNFSSRGSIELTDLYNYWYTTTWQGLDETVYTGFTPTGSVYGIWRANTFYPLTAYMVTNSVISPPPLTAGIWAKNFAHHFYLDTFPPCPAQEPEYGQSFSPDSSYNSYVPWVPGLAALITMYQGNNEGEYLNYWMQHIWNDCSNPSGTLPESNPMWIAANLQGGGLGNAYQSWFYLYTDPAYATNSNLPTGSVDNYADNASATSGTPMAGMMSRTGYSSITDTLVTFYALAAQDEDHNLPNGGFQPADYRIFKGSFLLADDDSAGAYNAGGPFSMAMEIGGDTSVIGSFPWVDKMPVGHSDPNYTFACTDSTQSYVAGANASAVYRCLVHFKKASTQDFVVAADYVASTAGNAKQTYLHYAQTAFTGGSCPTSTGSTSFTAHAVKSTFNGTSSIANVDESQLLSSILTPNSSTPVYAYVQNSNGTYAGGNGCTFRVSLCAATTGAPNACNAANTAAEFAVIHEPVTGSGNAMPSTSMLATIDGSHRGVEIDGASPKVFIYPVTMLTSTYTSASFTTAHSGSAQYVVAGLTPGTYDVKVNGSSIITGAIVSTGDNSLYFENTSGSVVVTQTGATYYTLSTSTAGTGTGTVIGCAGSYESGEAYSCTANPGTGSTFASWSGTCGGAGSGSTYAGNMPSAACTVTATFNLAAAATPTFSPAAGSYTTAQMVQILVTTPNAKIYYTTNGTTPTTNSALYGSAITVSGAETLKAIATATGFLQSAVGSASYIVGPPAAIPTFGLPAGTYTSSPQTVTISDTTPGATIYYAINAIPTTSSSVYSSANPISVTSAETIEAIAIAPGYTQSATASATYTINLPFAGPVYVQQCNSFIQYGETLSCTLNGVGAGHTLAIGIANLAAAQAGTATSSAGTPIHEVTDSQSLDGWMLPNTSAGSNTITYTVGANTRLWLSVIEYANTATSPLDGTAAAVDTVYGSAIDTPNLTTTVGSDLLWSYCIAYGTITPGTAPVPWTGRTSPSGGGGFLLVEDGNTTTAGAYHGECGASEGEIVTMALKAPHSAVPGILTSPTPESTLTGPSVMFSWSAGVGATGYQLWLGTTGVNSHDVYASGIVTGTSVTPLRLPINGGTIYARLYTEIDGNWLHRDYTYTATSPSVLTAPGQGATLAGPITKFTWTAPAGAGLYQLWLGTTGVNSSNVFSSGQTHATTTTRTNMPTHGETIYARLFTNFSGTWVSGYYTFTAPTQSAPISPAPGTTLSGPITTFSWTASAQAGAYQFWLGSTGAGSNNVYSSGLVHGTSLTRTNLPTDGETLYARLYTDLNGTWVHQDYTLTAAAASVMTSPAAGSTLAGASTTFTWSAGTEASGYQLWLGSTGAGSHDLYSSGVTSALSVTRTNLPTNGETIYARLYTSYNGTWVHTDYTFKAAP